tara:strand:- start:979 stop:1326 length:348 start_codon:yes stop_codon:yes gene_type:complete
MSNVVSLAEYKKRKSEKEINRLEAELADLIEELDLDVIPQPYFTPVDYDYAYGSPGSGVGGVLAKFSPTIKDCVVDLQFISMILSSLGESTASNDIDKIVEKLNAKENSNGQVAD